MAGGANKLDAAEREALVKAVKDEIARGLDESWALSVVARKKGINRTSVELWYRRSLIGNPLTEDRPTIPRKFEPEPANPLHKGSLYVDTDSPPAQIEEVLSKVYPSTAALVTELSQLTRSSETLRSQLVNELHDIKRTLKDIARMYECDLRSRNVETRVPNKDAGG